MLFRWFITLITVYVLVMSTTACFGSKQKPDDAVHTFTVSLKKTADSLNAVAKANRSLYQSLGASYLQTRIKVATGVHQANEYVIAALEFAKNLTPANFPQNKLQALQFLSNALTAITAVKIGKPEVDLLIQTVVGLLNNSIAIVTALTSKAIRYINAIDVAELQNYFRSSEYAWEATVAWTN